VGRDGLLACLQEWSEVINEEGQDSQHSRNERLEYSIASSPAMWTKTKLIPGHGLQAQQEEAHVLE
jgi:hypothetical protein